MKAAVKMPQKCFKPFRILGPSESFCDAPDAQKSQILKVKSLTSLHDTSGTIQSCPLQLHSPAFPSLRRGLTRNFSLDYTPGWTDTLRYAQEVIRALKHGPQSRSQRTHGFFIPTEFLEYSLF